MTRNPSAETEIERARIYRLIYRDGPMRAADKLARELVFAHEALREFCKPEPAMLPMAQA